MLSWLRQPLPPGPPYAFRLVAWSGVLALAIVLLGLPTGSAQQARAAFSAIGCLLVLSAQLRPASLWNAGSTQEWRLVLGDRLTALVLTAIGVVILLAGWLLPLPRS
jgi:hypothetical protein